MLTQKNYMKLEFPARSVNEGFARAAVAAFAAQLDPTLAEIGDIKTAVSEAVTNAVVHAYPDKLGTVQVRVRILPDERLEIAVKDHGIGIADVAQARTPLVPTSMPTNSSVMRPHHGLRDYVFFVGRRVSFRCAAARLGD